ncbi:MAG: HEPN domain-containing protein [bacterium]
MDTEKLLNNFKEYLLTSDIKGKIAKIVLFGSYAKKTNVSSSDIDILIFTLNGKGIERPLMDKAYTFMMDNNAPFEILISSIDSLFFQDYFIYNVTHYGKEVYSMEKEEIKREAMRDMIDLSQEYLEGAKEVFKRKRIRLAIDAAYNSAELAAKALILSKQDDLPGSHGGVASLFGFLYVKTNEIAKETGHRLNIALRIRNEARYKPNALLTKENAQEVITLAEDLIKIAFRKTTGIAKDATIFNSR